jgi:transcriptional regulator with XRE-family HTH domain
MTTTTTTTTAKIRVDGAAVRRRRIARGLIQRELAADARMDSPYLSKIESDSVACYSLPIAMHLAEALCCQITDLITDKPIKNKPIKKETAS